MPGDSFSVQARRATVREAGNFVVKESGLTDSSYMIRDEEKCYWELMVDDCNLNSGLPLNDTVISIFPTEVRGDAILMRMDSQGLRDIPRDMTISKLKELFKTHGIYDEPQECTRCKEEFGYIRLKKIEQRRLFWNTGLCPSCFRDQVRHLIESEPSTSSLEIIKEP